LVFSSLSEFFDDLEMHVTEEKLLAFSKSGFISPIEDRLSSSFLDDVIANLPIEWKVHDNDPKTPEDDWVSNALMPDDDWDSNALMPDDDWDSKALTTDELFYGSLLAKTVAATDINESWEQAKQNTLQIGSIACSFSDNSFGVVEGLEANQVTLKVIAQARVLVDGMKLYPQPGYLFTSAESFYFVKSSPNETYPLSDIATCNIEYLKRGQA
jgi:hypothetical protein